MNIFLEYYFSNLIFILIFFLCFGLSLFYQTTSSAAMPGASPHQALRYEPDTTCANCHQAIPLDGQQLQEIIYSLKADYQKSCLGCHQKKIPLSCSWVCDQEITRKLIRQIPDLSLPLRQGQITCVSCHIVHSSSPLDNTLAHLRAEYSFFWKKADQINPHQPRVFCLICHLKEPRGNASKPYLRGQEDISPLCQSCHNNRRAVADNHPIHLAPSIEKGVEIPAHFPLYNNQLTCLTCHDLSPESQDQNPFFIRGGPYQRLLDVCLSCHVKEKYQKINPHDLINEDQHTINEEKCLFCHYLKDPSSPEAVFTFRAPFRFYCLGCHPISVKKHPVMTQHTGKYIQTLWAGLTLSEMETLARQERFKIFPLHITGEILCTTCHNPHDPRKGSKLRISPVNESCRQCHYQVYGLELSFTEQPASWLPPPKWPFPSLSPSGKDLDEFIPHREETHSFSFKASLQYYCVGCHMKQQEKHPFGVTHSGRFIKHFLAPKGRAQKECGEFIQNEILPLSFCGQIGCFTCHDPHQHDEVNKGKKLRITDTKKLCSLCHLPREGEKSHDAP